MNKESEKNRDLSDLEAAFTISLAIIFLLTAINTPVDNDITNYKNIFFASPALATIAVGLGYLNIKAWVLFSSFILSSYDAARSKQSKALTLLGFLFLKVFIIVVAVFVFFTANPKELLGLVLNFFFFLLVGSALLVVKRMTKTG